MLALLLAGALSLLSLCISIRYYLRCRRLLGVGAPSNSETAVTPLPDEDELERRLAARERALELGLATRSVQVLGRASLFGGTGAAVWQLSGGSSQYLSAGMAFGVGCIGWAGCGELQRRVGLLAGRLPRRARYARTEVDPPSGSG